MSDCIASYTQYTLRFKKPAGTSRGVLRTKTVYFLRLADRRHPDRIAVGECAPWPGLSLDDRPDFEAQLAAVCRRLNRGVPPAELDLSAFPALAFGLEMALRDRQGGSVRRLFDTPFTRGETSLPIHGLIWMGSRQAMAQQVEEKIAQGFSCLKMKIGALPFAEEVALLTEIRRRYPADRIALRLDANGAFSPRDALARLTELAPLHIEAVEQPIRPGQWPALAELCARSPIPIALDEELIGLQTDEGRRRLLDAVRPQFLVLKPMLLGGFAAAERWMALAAERGIGWWVNSALESNIGLNALAQWVSTHPSERVQALGSGQLYANNIPAPIRLAGNGLVMDTRRRWDVTALVEGAWQPAN